MPDATLNQTALSRCRELVASAERLGVTTSELDGARIIDCGVDVDGGIGAGLALAEICLAGRGKVQLSAQQGMSAQQGKVWPGPSITVQTDEPVLACMGSQYAGWPVSPPDSKFFAMGSGPMRACRGKEPLLQQLGIGEPADEVIGVLESGKLPATDACRYLAEECGASPDRLTILVAPTSSIAGTVQVVARSVETCLHKMHELGFPLNQVISACGSAPLPPIANDDMQGIGLTNDAILYGGQVTIWLRGEDDTISELGSRIPSEASPDAGRPFIEIFEACDRDFYKIDPMLFSPAEVRLANLSSGREFHFGSSKPDILRMSFSRGS